MPSEVAPGAGKLRQSLLYRQGLAPFDSVGAAWEGKRRRKARGFRSIDNVGLDHAVLEAAKE